MRFAPVVEGGSQAQRLRAMAEELLALADAMENEELCRNSKSAFDKLSLQTLSNQLSSTLAARLVYRERRRRQQFFDNKLFGEPAWDILLDLYAAAENGRPVYVTDACVAADAPLTTALRWISVLENAGLIVREADKADARRILVRLSADGRFRMDQFFSGTPAQGEIEDAASAIVGMQVTI